MPLTKNTFTFIADQPLPYYAAVAQQLPDRPGVDGHAFQHVGKRGGTVTLQCHKLVADAAAWSTFDTALKGCQGTECEIESTAGGWTKTVFLHRVLPLDLAARAVASSDGSTKIWRGALEITLLS
jgi:hypothetical protein